MYISVQANNIFHSFNVKCATHLVVWKNDERTTARRFNDDGQEFRIHRTKCWVPATFRHTNIVITLFTFQCCAVNMSKFWAPYYPKGHVDWIANDSLVNSLFFFSTYLVFLSVCVLFLFFLYTHALSLSLSLAIQCVFQPICNTPILGTTKSVKCKQHTIIERYRFMDEKCSDWGGKNKWFWKLWSSYF